MCVCVCVFPSPILFKSLGVVAPPPWVLQQQLPWQQQLRGRGGGRRSQETAAGCGRGLDRARVSMFQTRSVSHSRCDAAALLYGVDTTCAGPLRIQHRVTMRFGWRGVIAHTTTPGSSATPLCSSTHSSQENESPSGRTRTSSQRTQKSSRGSSQSPKTL